MNKTNVFHNVNTQIRQFQNQNSHRKNPIVPFKMIVDERANLLVFSTKREYLEYLETRDIELCKF